MNYEGNRPLISPEDQYLLGKKKIAILGLGGLGGYLAHGALRLGVRKMILIDGDVFDDSNINRQLFCTGETLGKYKVEVVKNALLAIDPGADIRIYKKRIQSVEDADLFDNVDLILDGLDSISSRYLLMEIAMKKNVPLIHGAIGGFEAQLAFLEPDKDRMKTIYPWEEEISSANLSFVPSFLASLQVKMMLEYFLLREDLEKNTLIRIDLAGLHLYKIPLDV